MRRALRLAGPVLAAALAAFAAPVAADTLTIGYLALKGDPRHDEVRSYTGVVVRPATDPFQGAETALREGRILGRALDLSFALDRIEAASAGDLAAEAAALRERGVRFVLADLPAPALAELARATRGHGLALFNVSAYADSLRGADCQPHLLHVLPSRAMLMDTLAQHVASRRWTDVLVLQGPAPADAETVRAFRRAAGRFGLSIVDVRSFTQAGDPRERESSNVALLTGDADYDLIFVADADAGLGRHVAYRSFLPRPVIGDTGLVPAAWHHAYERHGAPQVSKRFEEVAGRPMRDAGWAAWAATGLILRAAAATRGSDADAMLAWLRNDDLTFDTSKGAPGSFRDCNNQLRQPILLHTGDAVIARAPVAGFLHPRNELDTLGDDRPESSCDGGG